jgi:hypothetical protein
VHEKAIQNVQTMTLTALVLKMHFKLSHLPIAILKIMAANGNLDCKRLMVAFQFVLLALTERPPEHHGKQKHVSTPSDHT